MGPRGQALSLRRGELPWPREQWLFLCLAWPGLRVLVFVMAGFVLSEVQCVDSRGLLKMVCLHTRRIQSSRTCGRQAGRGVSPLRLCVQECKEDTRGLKRKECTPHQCSIKTVCSYNARSGSR